MNEALSEQIANSLQLTDSYKKVVEVGPGRGMLTKYLLQHDFELIVVEADRDMVFYLKKHYPKLIGQIIGRGLFKSSFKYLYKKRIVWTNWQFPL